MNFKNIQNNLKTKEKVVFLELSPEELQTILKDENDKHIVIKFGATWCVPCKKIETVLHDSFLEMPDTVYCFDLDVDDNIELFGKLKSKKMVKTIPALLYYNCKSDRNDKWYVSDMSLFSSDNDDVMNFFKQIYNNL